MSRRDYLRELRRQVERLEKAAPRPQRIDWSALANGDLDRFAASLPEPLPPPRPAGDPVEARILAMEQAAAAVTTAPTTN